MINKKPSKRNTETFYQVPSAFYKNFYKNPTANIILNGEKLDAFPLR